MISQELRFFLTKEEIVYSDAYDEHQELFDKGINLLNGRLKDHNFTEFSDNERELLEDIFTKMEASYDN